MLVEKEKDGMIKISAIHPSEAKIMANAYDLLQAVNYHLEHNDDESLEVLKSVASKSNKYQELMGSPK